MKSLRSEPERVCLVVLVLHPFIDSDGVLRVGGRKRNSHLAYPQMHPIILHGKQVLTRLIIRSEHLRLLHAGPTLVFPSLAVFTFLGLRLSDWTGRPLCALPDPSSSHHSVSLLNLCQNLIRHFWRRWSDEYLTSLNKFNKWHHPTRNLRVGDVIVLQEDNLVPTKWPLVRVTQVHCGRDGLIRVKDTRRNIQETSNKTYSSAFKH